MERARDAGLEVELAEEGERRGVPPGVDLAAYRIVQEALTNARKHAGPVAAQVHVRYLDSAVEVEVVNAAGSGAQNGEGAGHGLVGMRERARVYGGDARDRARARRRLSGPRAPAAGGGAVIRVLVADDQALVRGGLGRHPRRPGGHRGGGRGGGRRQGGGRGTAPAPRRGADGRADAERRRHRGHQAPRRARGRPASARAHHLRPGRVRLRVAARGRRWLPAQGRAARPPGGRRSAPSPPASRCSLRRSRAGWWSAS